MHFDGRFTHRQRALERRRQALLSSRSAISISLFFFGKSIYASKRKTRQPINDQRLAVAGAWRYHCSGSYRPHPTHPGWVSNRRNKKRNIENTQETKIVHRGGGAAVLSLVTKRQRLANCYLVWFSPFHRKETTNNMPVSWYTPYALGKGPSLHSCLTFIRRGSRWLVIALLGDAWCLFLASFFFLVQLPSP